MRYSKKKLQNINNFWKRKSVSSISDKKNNTRKSKNNTQLQKVRGSKKSGIRGGNGNLIHILYGLGHKNQNNQVVVIGVSTNIINLYLKAMDFPEDIYFSEWSDFTKSVSVFKNVLLKNMVIDTIELNNSSTTHTWQIIDIPDIIAKYKNKTYVYTEIEPTELQYTYDKSSQITGVIGNLYSNEVNVSDGKIRTEDTNPAAYELFDKYEPLDFELNVVDQKLTITKGMYLSKFIEAFPDEILYNWPIILRHFSFDEYYPTLLQLNKKDTLNKIFLQWYRSLSDVIKESGNTLTVKDFINLDISINLLKKHYTLQEIWEGLPKSTFEEILNSIRDLHTDYFKLEDIIKLDGLTIEHYVNYVLLYYKNDTSRISLDKLLELFKLKDVYDWINNGSVVYTKKSRMNYFENRLVIETDTEFTKDSVNISLKDLLMRYKDNIPELLTVTTPEFLFYTGLYTYRELKPWLKELTGKREELFRKRADLCKKNWKRQTNLLCRYVPSSFPKNDRDSPSGHLDNTKEQYDP
jgi:hypothetical protein